MDQTSNGSCTTIVCFSLVSKYVALLFSDSRFFPSSGFAITYSLTVICTHLIEGAEHKEGTPTLLKSNSLDIAEHFHLTFCQQEFSSNLLEVTEAGKYHFVGPAILLLLWGKKLIFVDLWQFFPQLPSMKSNLSLPHPPGPLTTPQNFFFFFF